MTDKIFHSRPNAKLSCRRDSGGQLERWVRLCVVKHAALKLDELNFTPTPFIRQSALQIM